MTTNDGGPAFPHSRLGSDHDGMTLRDYFAAKALPAIYKNACEFASVHGWPDDWRNEVANEAYEMADVMLKARDA